VGGDRDASSPGHADRAQPTGAAPTTGTATSGAAISAVAGAVARGPSAVAAVLRQLPGQRSAILSWLQSSCGNAFVQAVIADPPPGEAAAAWDVVAMPHTVQFPETEVGAVSPPRTITLINRGYVALELASLEFVMNGGTGEAAHPGEFELIEGQPKTLGPLQTMAVQVVFRPSRALPHIGAHLRGKGSAAHQQVEVALKASAAPPRAEHAEQRELSVAEHEARGLEVAAPSSVQHYGDMLAAVLAARTLTKRAKPGETANPQIAKLLEPVARRLNELNDHQGRFAEFGAGNLAGQAALDMSESAIRRWLQLAALGGMIQSDELVTKFRVGAEPIRFLTGERGDAPTLRAFGQASRTVAIGSAALALGPALVALAVEEAALLGFAVQLGSRQVAVWALANPAAALAASEALIGFGVQLGQDGLDTFWDQLHDPQGCLFVVAQVLMDFMHVRGGMAEHAAEPAQRRSPSLDLEAAREHTARVRAVLQQVNDAAASETGATTTTPKAEGDVHPPPAYEPPATAAQSPETSAHEPPAASAHEPSVTSAHEPPATSVSSARAAHEPPAMSTPQPSEAPPVAARVSNPVPGLYEAIDPTTTPRGWNITDESLIQPDPSHPELVQITTRVVAPNGKRGWIQRSYDSKTKTFVMENAFLQELPAWIDVGTPLVPGKGTPTVTYLTLRQMKQLEAQFGELSTIKMSRIYSIEAAMQLEQLTRAQPNTPLDQLVAKTHSVQYATTAIEQSGHKIVGIRVDTRSTRRWSLQKLMDHFGTDSARRSDLFAKYSLRPEDDVLLDYNIWIDVAPHPSNSTP